MRFTAREKPLVRRVLREIKAAAHTAHASGFIHPETVPGATPSDTLISVAYLFASLWGIDINAVGEEPPKYEHLQPRVGPKLREKRRADFQASQRKRDDLSTPKQVD